MKKLRFTAEATLSVRFRGNPTKGRPQGKGRKIFFAGGIDGAWGTW